MIPLDEAMAAETWLLVTRRDREYGEVNFRVKPLSLSKVDMTLIDFPDRLRIDISANLWLLSVDVVNIERSPVPGWAFRRSIILMDEEKFEFHFCNDDHINFGSDFSKSAGLESTYFEDLQPKIRKRKYIAFELPTDFEKLYLHTTDGQMSEI